MKIKCAYKKLILTKIDVDNHPPLDGIGLDIANYFYGSVPAQVYDDIFVNMAKKLIKIENFHNFTDMEISAFKLVIAAMERK